MLKHTGSTVDVLCLKTGPSHSVRYLARRSSIYPTRILHIGCAAHKGYRGGIDAISSWYSLSKNIAQTHADGGLLTGMGRRDLKSIIGAMAELGDRLFAALLTERFS